MSRPVISALTYAPGFGYTLEDFEAVQMQLVTEIGYVDQVSKLCGLVRQLTDQQGTTLQQQLTLVGSNIDSSLRQKAVDAQIKVDELTKYSDLASLGSKIPYIGSAFSAVSTLLSASAQLTSVDAKIPGDFTYTLAQLQDRNNNLFGTRLSLLITNTFTAIADDWGKLQTIGGGFGQQRAPWFFCANCDTATLPIVALPTIALGAKRDYYKTLLPTAFAIDLLTEQASPDVKSYQRERFNTWGNRVCFSPYDNFSTRSYWVYPALYKPTAYDLYILNEKGRNGDYAIPPTEGLLSDLFGAPDIDASSYTLSGGAGLTQDDLIKAGSDFIQRPGYASGFNPGSTCRRSDALSLTRPLLPDTSPGWNSSPLDR